MPKFAPRKLLVAAVGVATVNYVACGKTQKEVPTSANLPAPIVVPDASVAPLEEDSGAIAIPPPPNVDGGIRIAPVSGNLVVPPPPKPGGDPCASPFTVDSKGIRRPKPECFGKR